jgi:hypothetical protein
MDKAKGAAHNAVGDAKDTARDAMAPLRHNKKAAPVWAAFSLAISHSASALTFYADPRGAQLRDRRLLPH